MRNQIFNFLLRLVIFTLVLYAAHYLLVNYVVENKDFYYPAIYIYIFNFLATLTTFVFLIFTHKTFEDRTGFAFMGANFIKMVAAVIFLFPMLLNFEGNGFGNLLSFFIPYFLYLIFETFYAVKLINNK